MNTVLWANILYWPFIHLVISKFSLKRKLDKFRYDSLLYRERTWEREGLFYRRYFLIKRWKRLLPDGARWIGHTYGKQDLAKNRTQLPLFLKETRRSEWAHWVTLAFAPVPFLWNPTWAGAVLFAYGILANVPCILAQRYNRLVVVKMLQIRSRSQKNC